ncbi:hypothetical protein [Deinococcus apachensis]|uniref:hypothetical protein n=1 Tax=Deinococcus apachensis TaxID=309886 RepID=UPI00036BB141|nr:hypothetical protein [Deinococcus apachensis]
MSLKLKLLDFWRYNRMILGVSDPTDPEAAVPVSPDAPLPVREARGSTLSEFDLVLTNVPQGLPPKPAGARTAELYVDGGDARTRTSSATLNANAGVLWPDGSGWEVSGDDLAALRAVIGSGAPVLRGKWVG